jgi:hypothetical protein
MVLEAGYPGTTGFRKVTKVTVMIRKKEGISDEDFIEHYNNVHAQLAAPVLLRHKIITYSLVGLCWSFVCLFCIVSNFLGLEPVCSFMSRYISPLAVHP